MMVVMLVACATGTPGGAPTWHEDVRPIVDRDCLGCHEDGSPSGVVLASYDEAVPWLPAIGVAVEERTMPPWLADDDCNAYRDDFSLSDADRRTLLDWVDAGGPEGDPALAPPRVDPRPVPALERVDRTLAMPDAYTPVLAPDDYRCFLLDWPEAETTWVTGYEVLPGNPDVVHHVIAFLIDPADVPSYREIDAADADPGYTCFGGPGGDLDSLLRTGWLGGWAPGTGAIRMPEGTGIEIAPGSLVVMQVHYNIGPAGPGPDRTSMAVSVERDEQEWVSLEPWTDVRWILGTGMDIPAGTEGVEHVYAYTLGGDDAFAIHGGGLHLHTLARSARLEVRHADGRTSCIVDIPRYDFDWQREYRLAEPIEARAGDEVRLTCVWDNPTDRDVAWGEGTSDEMCLGLTLLTE